MGTIGNPVVTGLVQAAQAQQVAARERDRARNAQEAARERADRLELRVEQAEAPEAVGPVSDDERSPDDGRRERGPDHGGDGSGPGSAPEGASPPDEPRPSLDLQA